MAGVASHGSASDKESTQINQSFHARPKAGMDQRESTPFKNPC